jgi:hypothetical protein
MYKGVCGPGTFDATRVPLRLNAAIAGACKAPGILPIMPSTINVIGGWSEPFNARIVACIA